MTEPTPTTDELLAARYGARSPQHRRRVVAALTCLVLVALAFLGWTAWVHSNPSVRGELEGFQVVSEHEIQVVIALERDSGDAVRCLVRAQAADHTVVGEQSVTIPSGTSGSVRFVATVSTDRAATTVTVTGCR